MARLHEYQGKALLRQHGIGVPDGRVVASAAEASAAASDLGGRAILKAQAWITGRKAMGGVVVAGSPEEASAAATSLLALRFGNFPVTEVLVEQCLEIRHELFVSLSIDDASQAPILLLDLQGGSGIEERGESVARLPVDVRKGIDAGAVREQLARSTVDRAAHEAIVTAVQSIVRIAQEHEARSLEVNPLAVTASGDVVALDCRITIDDYAVFRHPELGIEIARELDHPATPLERVAYRVEQDDHRGTFYFAQLPTDGAGDTGALIGFHGAGGGGSMMSMDAVTNAGFTLANFCDTSGNPSVAKVYRAARIILAQPGIRGYFGSGSGVASQEQYHSAYGLAKAFLEMNMPMPVVIRLGGNSEDRAVEILENACRDLPGTVRGFTKDDTPASCAERFRSLMADSPLPPERLHRDVPAFVGSDDAMSFPIRDGRVWIDLPHCDEATSKFVVEQGAGLIGQDARGRPTLAVTEEEVAARDSELVALEIECRRAGRPVVFVDLEIPGLEEAIAAAAA